MVSALLEEIEVMGVRNNAVSLCPGFPHIFLSKCVRTKVFFVKWRLFFEELYVRRSTYVGGELYFEDLLCFIF